MHLRSRVFDTLFLHAPKMQQIPTKIDTKLSNGTLCTQNTIKHIYNKNWGYSTIINKQERISATKHIYKITTFWNLSTLPNLTHCLSSNNVKQLKETKNDNQIITNQQVFKTENK